MHNSHEGPADASKEVKVNRVRELVEVMEGMLSLKKKEELEVAEVAHSLSCVKIIAVCVCVCVVLGPVIAPLDNGGSERALRIELLHQCIHLCGHSGVVTNVTLLLTFILAC